VYEKAAFNPFGPSKRGVGLLHSGHAGLLSFLVGFRMDDRQKQDIAAFLMAFSTPTFPCVGQQVTLIGRVAKRAEEPPARLTLF
jgi:hypothetical protein